MSEQRILKCHCGAVEVTVQFDNGLENIRSAKDLVKINGKMHKIYFLSALLVTHNKSPYFQGTFISSNGCCGNYEMRYLTIGGKPYVFKPPAMH